VRGVASAAAFFSPSAASTFLLAAVPFLLVVVVALSFPFSLSWDSAAGSEALEARVVRVDLGCEVLGCGGPLVALLGASGRSS
jgi:hypothetical protein